jgi:hypothetical protein
MSDDFVAGGILPLNDNVIDADAFDPDAVESDDFLDDSEDELLAEDAPLGILADEDEDLFGEEI